MAVALYFFWGGGGGWAKLAFGLFGNMLCGLPSSDWVHDVEAAETPAESYSGWWLWCRWESDYSAFCFCFQSFWLVTSLCAGEIVFSWVELSFNRTWHCIVHTTLRAFFPPLRTTNKNSGTENFPSFTRDSSPDYNGLLSALFFLHARSYLVVFIGFPGSRVLKSSVIDETRECWHTFKSNTLEIGGAARETYIFLSLNLQPHGGIEWMFLYSHALKG